jgi:hypothetical protein
MVDKRKLNGERRQRGDRNQNNDRLQHILDGIVLARNLIEQRMKNLSFFKPRRPTLLLEPLKLSTWNHRPSFPSQPKLVSLISVVFIFLFCIISGLRKSAKNGQGKR